MNLFIYEDITEALLNKISKEILESKDKSITIYLNCPGGEDGPDYALFDLLVNCGKKIITVNMFEVSSAGIVVYLAGTERYALPMAKFMLHESWQESNKEDVKTSDYKRSIEFLEQANDRYFTFVSERTKLTKNKIKTEIKNSPEGDWWFDANIAKRFGLCTQIGLPK